MAEWISVKDKLPEMDRIVMICRDFGMGPIYDWGARIDDGEGWLWGVCGHFGLHPTESADYNDVNSDDDYNVTHWMPLPALPVSTAQRET